MSASRRFRCNLTGWDGQGPEFHPGYPVEDSDDGQRLAERVEGLELRLEGRRPGFPLRTSPLLTIAAGVQLEEKRMSMVVRLRED